jgi:hypothetical protein
MKGSILDFSTQKNEGLITGDDNNRYTFARSEWRPSEPPVRGMRVDFETRDTVAAGVYRELTEAAVETAQEIGNQVNLVGLSPYYQEQFKKIHASGESYRGKWNWAAFFFGAVWALTKGAWKSALTALVVTICTGGFGGVIYWFVFGMRGNYIYYTLHVKKKQLFG